MMRIASAAPSRSCPDAGTRGGRGQEEEDGSKMVNRRAFAIALSPVCNGEKIICAAKVLNSLRNVSLSANLYPQIDCIYPANNS